jgi:ankyrin repeat protein
MLASQNGHTDIVEKLILSGANVDSRNGFGSSALALAAERNRKESVELLIEHGANVNFRDNDGNTALILASRNGNADIVKKLLSGGAAVSIAGDNGMTALSYVLERSGTKKDPIYKMLKASLNRPRVVNTEQDLFRSQSASIVAPSTSMTAMTVTALFAVGLAALFMWKRKGIYADPETRPRAEVKNPLAEKTKKDVKHKGKTS